MGILTVISPSCDISAAETSFQCALHAMRGTALRAIDVTVRNEWSLAASVARQSGLASTIASDPKTGSWLAVVGTCFHRSGEGDPHYLLSQYLSVGLEELVQSLEGFFTIAIGDAAGKAIVLITDLIGSCHFYVRSLPGGAALSSSSHVLSGLGVSNSGCDRMPGVLGMGIIYEERTLHNEIRKLPPATVIKFRNGVEVNRHAYWDPRSLTPGSIADGDAVDRTWQALVSAVSKIGRRYERVVCDLTGGYDSRAMVAGFLGAGLRPVTVVSGNENSADVVISRGLADRLSLPHLHMTRQDPVSVEELRNSGRLTDGEGDAVEYASTAAIHRELSQRFQISVNGSFGEVARAYWWELLAPHTGSRRPIDSHMLAARRYAWNSSDDLFQTRFRMNLIDHMSGVVDRSTAELWTSRTLFRWISPTLGCECTAGKAGLRAVPTRYGPVFLLLCFVACWRSCCNRALRCVGEVSWFGECWQSTNLRWRIIRWNMDIPRGQQPWAPFQDSGQLSVITAAESSTSSNQIGSQISQPRRGEAFD